MDFHCFTGKSDDAFNKKLLFVIRVSEDNDIEPFRFAEYISKPVSENTVSGHDRILHRTGRNFRIYKTKRLTQRAMITAIASVSIQWKSSFLSEGSCSGSSDSCFWSKH